MHLLKANGEKVKISLGTRIFYNIDTTEISFTGTTSEKLYFITHDDSYYLGISNPEIFVKIAWLFGKILGLKIHRLNTPSDVLAFEFLDPLEGRVKCPATCVCTLSPSA